MDFGPDNQSMRLYIMGEINTPELRGSKHYFKVGITSTYSGYNSGPDDFRERIRALNQGNPRGLEVLKYWIGPEHVIKGAEKQLHNSGIYVTRFDETGMTGHREWIKTFKLDELINIISLAVGSSPRNPEKTLHLNINKFFEIKE